MSRWRTERTGRMIFFAALFVVSGILQHLRADDCSLTIVPSDVQQEDRISAKEPFHVVLANISQHDLYIFRENSTYGYDSLSFTVTTEDGKKFQISKTPRSWDKIVVDRYCVRPNCYFVWDVDFSSDEWHDISVIWGYEKVLLQAHFSIMDGAPFPQLAPIIKGTISSSTISAHLVR